MKLKVIIKVISIYDEYEYVYTSVCVWVFVFGLDKEQSKRYTSITLTRGVKLS